MAVSNQLKVQHLLWRTGFGPKAADVLNVPKIHPAKLYAAIQQQSQQKPAPIDVAANMVKNLLTGGGNITGAGMLTRGNLSKEQNEDIRKQSIEDLKNLNLRWLDELVNSDAQLREKMALFWHGHFACREINIYYQQLLLQQIRENALGNFADLLKAVSKSASMLRFLNNQQNRKQHPNENFAREVMELFTVGRGNYTEQDIKEAARAFTGWSFDLNGTFVFRKYAHDEGLKTILGKTGYFTGDDVLTILLEQPQTAQFITQKIYRYFVNDTIDAGHVQWLSKRFYESNYHIGLLMQDIFTSSWFYEEKNIGAKIKSPVELLAGIRRILPLEFQNEGVQLVLQKLLGQLLFYPPNVAGWAGGKTWIDSSTLMLRLRIPQLIKDADTYYVQLKPDDDQQMGMKDNFSRMITDKMNGTNLDRAGFRIIANINWDYFTQQFSKLHDDALFSGLQSLLLQTPPDSFNSQSFAGIQKKDTRADYIKTTTLAFMSTPEYQLC